MPYPPDSLEQYAINKHKLDPDSPLVGPLASLAKFDPDLPKTVKIPDDPGRAARVERMKAMVDTNNAIFGRNRKSKNV